MRPFLVVLLLFASSAFAAQPYLVTDLKALSAGAGSSPVFLSKTTNNVAFFVATDASSKSALWRTDGTSAGTFQLLALTNTQAQAFGPPIPAGNVAYFALNEAGVWKLWRTDGTVAGTAAQETFSFTASFLGVTSVVGDDIFLLRDTKELWVRDSSGVRMLTTIRSSALSGQWTTVAASGNGVYVGHESGLWRSDGTVAGTAKIANAGALNFATLNNRTYYFGFGAEGGELWTTDGTAAGTHIVTDFTPGSASTFVAFRSAMRVLGDKLVFLTANGNVGVSDGTPVGMRNLRIGVAPAQAFTPSMTILNDLAYVTFDDGVHGMELWVTDGTEAGTRMVRDASTSPTGSLTGLAAGATRIYYYGSEGASSRLDLFESDGTEAGTHPVRTNPPPGWRGSGGARATTATFGDTVLFTTDDGVHGTEPWISDGTDAGTRMLANIAVEAAGSSNPNSFVAGADRVYFFASSDSGVFFWSSDGTSAGTTQAFDIGTGEIPTPLAAVGNALYLTRGAELWRTDGTLASAKRIKVLPAALPRFTKPVAPIVVGGRVYFVGPPSGSDATSAQLWTTDGTADGTVQLTKLSDRPTSLVAFGGQVYFTAGGALWATDGTPAGTHGVVRAGDANVMATLGGSLVSVSGQVWKYSGAATDATKVTDLPSATVGTQFGRSIGNSILFTYWLDNTHTDQLWKTDGTAEGTALVRDFSTGSNPPKITEMVTLGNRAVFVADDSVHGLEPWVSDGTAEGTKLLRDINPSGSSDAGALVVADGLVYFRATDPDHGYELWQTDGTPEGTQPVADLVPGPLGSSAVPWTHVGNLLYLAATTPENGREPWAYPLPRPALTIDNAKAAKGAASIAITVRLTRASSQRLTVAYETADDTAQAGRDYTAASGIVTFEPGQTAKPISIAITNALPPGGARGFSVRLKNADAPIERGTAAAVIIDDAPVVDVSVLVNPGYLIAGIEVRNIGAAAASNVRLCIGRFPPDHEPRCGATFELRAGDVHAETLQVPDGSSGVVTATVTQWERDSNPANNIASVAISSALWVIPSTPRAGDVVTLAIARSQFDSETFNLSSSDPTIIAVPASMTVPTDKTVTIPLTALKSGTTTITESTAKFGSHSVVLHVLDASDARHPVAFGFNSSYLSFGARNDFQVFVDGATTSGAEPSGTVVLSEGGKTITTGQLVGHQALLSLAALLRGPHTITATYLGDANFADATASTSVFIANGTPTILAFSEPGTSDVRIVVRGVSGVPPIGTVTVKENGQTPRTVNGSLVAIDDSGSAATATGFSNIARTVSVDYSGDGNYGFTRVTIPIVPPTRGHAAHH